MIREDTAAPVGYRAQVQALSATFLPSGLQEVAFFSGFSSFSALCRPCLQRRICTCRTRPSQGVPLLQSLLQGDGQKKESSLILVLFLICSRRASICLSVSISAYFRTGLTFGASLPPPAWLPLLPHCLETDAVHKRTLRHAGQAFAYYT